jgi:hypothetical protein
MVVLCCLDVWSYFFLLSSHWCKLKAGRVSVSRAELGAAVVGEEGMEAPGFSSAFIRERIASAERWPKATTHFSGIFAAEMEVRQSLRGEFCCHAEYSLHQCTLACHAPVRSRICPRPVLAAHTRPRP